MSSAPARGAPADPSAPPAGTPRDALVQAEDSLARWIFAVCGAGVEGKEGATRVAAFGKACRADERAALAAGPPAATPGQREAAKQAALGALVASGLHVTPFNLDTIAEKCVDAVLAAAPPAGGQPSERLPSGPRTEEPDA